MSSSSFTVEFGVERRKNISYIKITEKFGIQCRKKVSHYVSSDYRIFAHDFFKKQHRIAFVTH